MALFREDRQLSEDPRAPGRSHLALVRLIPWLRPGRRSDASVDARFYTSKPGQNPLEIRLVSSLVNLTWTLLIFGAASHLFDIGPYLAPVVFILSSLVTVLIIVTILVPAHIATRLAHRSGWNVEGATMQSLVHQAVLLSACAAAAFDRHWVRWVGIIWIALVAVEILARAIETILPESEQSPSEL